MRLFCSEKQILAETEKLYCEAVAFYYELLKDRNELWTENLLTIQGQLEKLTVPGKDGRVPEYLPPGGKLPVKQENSDARTAKERMKEGCRVCGVRFTNTDSFAVCSVLDERSRPVSVKNCHGGNAYRYHCKTLLKKIEASKVFTDKDNVDQPNKKYYMRYKHLNEYYAHQVSREILDFCKENQAGIIVLPEYDEDFYRMTMYRSGNDSPLHLSTKIRNYLKYKAWAEGILVLELRADGTEKYCPICGSPGKKQSKLFICQNGHQINRFLNGSRNLACKCQQSFQKRSGSKS